MVGEGGCRGSVGEGGHGPSPDEALGQEHDGPRASAPANLWVRESGMVRGGGAAGGALGAWTAAGPPYMKVCAACLSAQAAVGGHRGCLCWPLLPAYHLLAGKAALHVPEVPTNPGPSSAAPQASEGFFQSFDGI